MADRINPNALSYWFPLIEAAGLPVPRTILVTMPQPVWETLYTGMNGETIEHPADPAEFFAAIAAAADTLGWPAFLRTDHTSHKHNWRKTCHLARREDIPEHVYNIAEFSEIAGFLTDLSWNRWAVREMLPTRPLGTCPAYGDMTICREFRFFVDGGLVRCWHPYWPAEALEQGEASFAPGESVETLNRLDPIDLEQLSAIASAAGAACGGSWSVDLLEVGNRWMVTDMAVAAASYHWPDCERARHG